MTQRAVIMEIDEENGSRSVIDIIEWTTDRLELNKRRLVRFLRKNQSAGKYEIHIYQLNNDTAKEEPIYKRSIKL